MWTLLSSWEASRSRLTNCIRPLRVWACSSQVKSEWPKQEKRRRTNEVEKVRTVKSFSGSARWNRTDPPTTIFHICSQESLACVIGWLVKSKAELRKRKDKIRVSAIEISHIFWHEIRRWRWSLLSYSGNALRRSLHSTRTEISSRQKSNKHCQIFSLKNKFSCMSWFLVLTASFSAPWRIGRLTTAVNRGLMSIDVVKMLTHKTTNCISFGYFDFFLWLSHRFNDHNSRQVTTHIAEKSLIYRFNFRCHCLMILRNFHFSVAIAFTQVSFDDSREMS